MNPKRFMSAEMFLLAEATGVHYHVCHVSTEQSVRLIRLAKQIGVNVTAEVCPHHLLLSDEDIPGLGCKLENESAAALAARRTGCHRRA